MEINVIVLLFYYDCINTNRKKLAAFELTDMTKLTIKYQNTGIILTVVQSPCSLSLVGLLDRKKVFGDNIAPRIVGSIPVPSLNEICV